MLFDSKVALVTGGGSGIGRATALALAREGAAVLIGNRNTQQGEEVVAAIREQGGTALFQLTDVTDPDAVQALVARAASEFGRLDLAFNNAGYGGAVGPIHEYAVEEAKRILDINVLGVFYSLKFEIELMLRFGGGSIVNNSSILGQKGTSGMGMYVASKHAIAGLTKSAALEYAKQGLRINAVAPGPIETPMLSATTGDPQVFAKYVPAGRIGQPEEIAEAVLWLLSDRASYVNGFTLAVDGGWNAK